ncbi:MAG: 16S rRNA (cytidine(1402)-2'-O)-methyltransferase [Pseudomonadota bacterium]
MIRNPQNDAEKGFQIGPQWFSVSTLEPGLYLAATPIGNLKDITIRVLEAFAGCDLVACEDTRVTAKLLRHYGIKNQTLSYNEHNSDAVGQRLLDEIKSGKAVVLASDAGMPLVSDPGFRLVKMANKKGINIIPLPGASAPLTALIASGLPNETWTFSGFLPNKQKQRLKTLEAYETAQSTLIFFESPKRLLASLTDMTAVFGQDRQACVARELTKMHEEIATGPLSDLCVRFSERDVKGEIVILVCGVRGEPVQDVKALLSELLQFHSVSSAAAEAAQLTGQSKRELYQLALKLKDE